MRAVPGEGKANGSCSGMVLRSCISCAQPAPPVPLSQAAQARGLEIRWCVCLDPGHPRVEGLRLGSYCPHPRLVGTSIARAQRDKWC